MCLALFMNWVYLPNFSFSGKMFCLKDRLIMKEIEADKTLEFIFRVKARTVVEPITLRLLSLRMIFSNFTFVSFF